ncbi:ABC transporter permease subunit, partial [Clostridioides difficile]
GIISVMTQSLILSIMALGVYITYKILDFPDMSADGSYTMGASIVAFSLTNGISPVVATLMAILCGCTAGLVTGILHIKFKISNFTFWYFSYGNAILYQFKNNGKIKYSSI